MKDGVKGFKSKYTPEEVEAKLDGMGGGSGSCAQPWDPTKADGYADPCLALYSLFYVAPTVNIANSVNTVEIGSTVDNVVVNWSPSGSNTLTTQSLTDVGLVPVGITSHSFTGLGLTSNKTWTISVVDDIPNSANASTTLVFSFKRYWGTASVDSVAFSLLTDINASTQLLGLISNEFSGTRNKNWTQNGNGEYIYYAYPASWGTNDPPFVVNGLPNTAWTMVVKNITNSSGYTEPYNIWITNTIQNGTGISIICQ